MSESIRSVQTDLFTPANGKGEKGEKGEVLSWATSSKLLATPCEQWPQYRPPEKKPRPTKADLQYQLARRYRAANVAAARIIRNDPARYPGVMQEWAQLFLSPRRWSNAA